MTPMARKLEMVIQGIFSVFTVFTVVAWLQLSVFERLFVKQISKVVLVVVAAVEYQ